MIGAFEAKRPSVGIFWLVDPGKGEARLLCAGCGLDAAEPYGDFLTFGDGHYTIWERWRRVGRGAEGELRGLVRRFEYEDWPRGRIVFNQATARFVLYADSQLMRAETIAEIAKRFALPANQTEVETDFHYQSGETPGALG